MNIPRVNLKVTDIVNVRLGIKHQFLMSRRSGKGVDIDIGFYLFR